VVVAVAVLIHNQVLQGNKETLQKMLLGLAEAIIEVKMGQVNTLIKAAPMVEAQVVAVADIPEDKAEAPLVATFLEKQGNAVAIFLYLQQAQVPTVLIIKADMPEVATLQMEPAKMGVWFF
jgi:hypothetical protein